LTNPQNPNQGGFMQNREIVDNIVLVQEAIHSSVTSKSKGMVIKLDMANAFDHVHHSFLFMVMEKFGFSTLSLNWWRLVLGSLGLLLL
jgi:hypothetical protein